MIFSYNYDMLCNTESTMIFDYIRHSRRNKLDYVAAPIYS
jgi:hypothetical protein